MPRLQRNRRFNVLAALGTAAHHGFERWAGVGIVLEPFLGRRRSNVLWSVVLTYWVGRALFDGRRAEPQLAFGAGTAVAGVVVHFVDWPWSLRFGVVPWLDEAEGFRPSLLPAYNTILYAWLVGGLGALVFETRRSNLRHAAVGFASAPMLLVSARHHFRWARERALAGDPDFTSDLLAA